MVMDAVGRRDKAGIAEIETCDIERFVQLVYGERAKWLWLGKPMKKGNHVHQPRQDHMGAGEGTGLNKDLVFRPDEHGGFAWKAKRAAGEGGASVGDSRQGSADPDTAGGQGEAATDDEEPRFGVFKRATGFGSGLGKFKGAVGLRSSHQAKNSVDTESPTSPVEDGMSKSKRPLFRRINSSPMASPSSPKSPTQDLRLDGALAQQREKRNATDPEQARKEASKAEGRKHPYPGAGGPSNDDLGPPIEQRKEDGENDESESDRATTVTIEPSIAESFYNGVDLDEALPTGPETEKEISRPLQRTLSFSHYVSVRVQEKNDDSYPRHLSFSLAEDSVLTWTDLVEDETEGNYNDAKAQLASQEILARQAKDIRLAINGLSVDTGQWTQRQLDTLQTYLQQADRDHEYLEDRLHNPHLEHVNWLQEHSEGVIREQRERLEEGGREIETLVSKLEYEIDGFKSRVEDVEAGVQDFAKGVDRVEERVAELEKDEELGRKCCIM